MFFEETKMHILQKLREVLPGRPSREDLQKRGIYKGTTSVRSSSLVHKIVMLLE